MGILETFWMLEGLFFVVKKALAQVHVSDGPVSFAGAVSNIYDGMIVREFGARFIVKDSTAVVLEVGVGIKVDRMRSIFVDGISIDISRNLLVPTDGGDNFGFVKLATISVMGGVGVVSFQTISSLSEEGIESTVDPSTVAVTSTTVNEHLF